MKKLMIFPFNGNGIEALDCINLDEYDFIGFVDDDSSKKSAIYEIFPRTMINKHQEIFVLAVPGGPLSYKTRVDTISSLAISRARFITAIHTHAIIGKNVQIGYNCLIMAGVVITSNAIIHDHICVLPNSVIHHDVIVDDYTLIGSNVLVAGGTTIGRNCYIGSGSNLINGIHIGENSLVGLGSNVLKSIPQNTRVAGNPAVNINTSKNVN